jgi:hypothetical protein
MLQGAASVAATAEQVATPNPGAAPIPKPGSPMDVAATSVATAMGTQVTNGAGGVDIVRSRRLPGTQAR